MLKKITTLIVGLIVSLSAVADDKSTLIERLENNQGFKAKFTQTVYSPEQEIVMEGEGTVEVARPDLFRWSAEFPDENLLVSDGKSLWYYSPFIEQVTIFDQQQAMAQTPFVLLTRNNDSDWSQYEIFKQADVFTLTQTDPDSTQGTFIIHISQTGKIDGFEVLEQDGQRTVFSFSSFVSEVPEHSRFQFFIPEGVEVDDQRS
jgi:outer membrane lipoprotein carrier protein